MAKNWRVRVSCVNEETWKEYTEEFYRDTLTDCARSVLTFKPKRGYKLSTVTMEENVTLL